MAAVSQQGMLLGTMLAGFTAVSAGLAARESYSGLGAFIALVGLGLLIYSAVGFYRIKAVGSTE